MQYAHRWVPLFALLGFALLSGCEERTPTGLFNDLADSTNVGLIQSVGKPFPDSEQTGAQVVNTGSSPNLLLGEQDGKRASILIRFGNIDSVQAEGVQLRLHASGNLGDSPIPFTASVHLATQAWQEDTVTFANFGSAFDPMPLATLNVVPVDSDTVVVELEAALINSWINRTADNFGLVIRPDGASFIKNFGSRNSLVASPSLRVFRTDGTFTDAFASEDVFIFELLSEPDAGPLYVGEGYSHRSMFHFDLSDIPSNATVNRAFLRLNVDAAHSFLGDTLGFGLNVQALTAPTTGLFDSTSTFSIDVRQVTSGTDSLFVTATNMGVAVQSWVARPETNYGMLLAPLLPGFGLQRTAFFSAAMDSARAPSLVVEYTVPPKTSKE